MAVSNDVKVANFDEVEKDKDKDPTLPSIQERMIYGPMFDLFDIMNKDSNKVKAQVLSGVSQDKADEVVGEVPSNKQCMCEHVIPLWDDVDFYEYKACLCPRSETVGFHLDTLHHSSFIYV